MKTLLIFSSLLLTGCTLVTPQPTHAALQETPTTQPITAGLPNPASAYCVEQGYKSEIRTATDSSQTGACVFPDGSECDEWAYFRNEYGPASQGGATTSPTEIPTPFPIDPADYQGWWTYINAVYGFSVMLPEDWIVDETTTFDPLMNGHWIILRPEKGIENFSIRMTFRRTGEDTSLWPTGVGAGSFVPQGTLDMGGHAVQRVLFVCPAGQVNEIWYQGAVEGEPNIHLGDLEFGIIFSYTGVYCQKGYSLEGKIQRVGELIIASLQVP